MSIYSGPEIVNDGLVLHLDAANPISYSGSGTVWKDLSGNEYNFTLYNSPIHTGKTFHFDGINQYASIGSSGLNLSPTGTRTLEIWFRVITTPLYLAGLLADQNSTSGAFMMRPEGYLVWRWDDSNITDSTSHQINESTWYQATVSLRNSYYVTYYINGEIDTPEFRTTDTGSSGVSSWSIARQNRLFDTNGYLYLNCEVAIVRQYNRLLQPLEIKQNYIATKGRFGL